MIESSVAKGSSFIRIYGEILGYGKFSVMKNSKYSVNYYLDVKLIIAGKPDSGGSAPALTTEQEIPINEEMYLSVEKLIATCKPNQRATFGFGNLELRVR